MLIYVKNDPEFESDARLRAHRLRAHLAELRWTSKRKRKRTAWPNLVHGCKRKPKRQPHARHQSPNLQMAGFLLLRMPGFQVLIGHPHFIQAFS